ncbi:S8 family serine peptidase [Paractinoplanes maris]|uniref:S8 family serine peptidase n=1 Tax=Paractinoplanes maris TaxID=1734446 RepID=UPI0020210684|nr:S8 family serine peptidase [Actinoplanes maris]
MGIRVSAAVAAAMTVVLVTGTAAQATPGDELAPLTAVPVGAEVVKDRYVVVLEKSAPAAARADLVGLARSRGAVVRRQYSAALNGFSATLPAAALADLRQDADVAHIEPVTVGHVAGDQTGRLLPWGLDRIDQLSQLGDGHFRYPATGHGVRIYVIDTGVRRTHSDFGGRAVAGRDFVDNDNDPQDCHGHGTHVAGTAAGHNFGVAKEATVVAIRVFDCEGEGTSDDTIAAVDWAAANHPAGTPGVVNYSIEEGGRSLGTDAAVDNLIRQRNVVFVAAAGNENRDACDLSPGWRPAVVTVGSIDQDDRRDPETNWGPCIDLFAPGVGIRSAVHNADTGDMTKSGTSMATPHVAGAAALYLQSNPTATAAQVHTALVDTSLKNTVEDEKGAPDRLLFIPALRTTTNSALNDMFNTYGNNADCSEWSGADATQSVPLPSGKRAWFFADTYLNKPSERAGFYRSSLRNSIVVQSGTSLRTITGGNTCKERRDDISFWERYANTPFTEPGSTAYYWPGDAMVVGSDVVKFLYRNEPQPPWWTDTHSAVVTVPISLLDGDGKVFTKKPTIIPPKYTYGTHPINWGVALVRSGSLVYIYGAGVVDANNNRKPYLARTELGNLANPDRWQFSIGSNVWSREGDQSSAAPISSMHVENGFSVAFLNGRYWLVQHEPSVNGGRIVGHPAGQPWLFTDWRVTLYTPPEGTRGPGNDYKFYYEARMHPGLGAPGKVVVSYNVNTSAVSVGCRSLAEHDGSIYRPRFLTVPLGRFDALAASPSPPPDQVPAMETLANDNSWYDGWASPQKEDGGCPLLNQPTTLSATANPDGTVWLNWSSYGRDIWYWVESRDVTTGSGWKRPELWQSGTSMTDIPVVDGDTQGHTFEWRVIPFGTGGGGEAPGSNIVQRKVTVQPPGQLLGVAATRLGNGQIRVNWNEATYPSNRVYYFVDHWNISAGQTAAQAVRSAPLDPGTTSLTTTFVPGVRMGFRVVARNVGGFSPPSATVEAVA